MKQKFKWLLALVAMVASVNLMRSAEATWTLVETAPADWSGEYLVVYNAGCFNGSLTTGFDQHTPVSVTISNKKITLDDEYAMFVAKSGDKYSFKTASGSYIGRNANSNGMDANATWSTNYTVTFSWNSTDKTVKISGNGGRALGRNGDTWRFYASSNAYTNLQLYKKDASTPTEPVAPSITTQPEGATYEKDATATALSVEASGNPAPTYQWYSNTTESTSGASAIANATNASYTPSTATVGTTYYYCVATNSKGSATSDIVAVTVTKGFDGKKLTFDFVNHPSGWPAVKADASAGEYTYTLNSVNYTFSHTKEGDGIYMGGTSGSSGYLMVAKSNNLGLPAISGYKLVKVEGTLNGSGSPSTKSEVSITDGTNVITGGTSQTWDTKGGVKTYSLTETEENTMYYLSVSSTANCQIITLTLYYEELAPTNEAVTFAAPEGGSLVIKNGATPIATGAAIQDGTILGVTFGMTPAEAYKDVAIKVTKTSTSEDVTEDVYDATEQQITMPRYAITVAVTFTKLYKISLETAGEGEGSATMNGVTTDIYVDGETQINLLASAVAPNEFISWSATDKILINEESEAETYAYASGDGTITATFGISELQPLDAPTLSDPTNVTYSGVTLNWQELANAEGYNVEILLNDETVASNVIIGETSWTPEVTLQANTTYTYTVQGVGDGTTYAEENNPKATSTFKTDDYPAATLTLSENGTPREVTGLKVNTPFYLPNCSVECNKIFVGWSISDTDHSNLMVAGSEYTMTETTGILYAWFATETPGTTTWNKVPTNYTDWVGNEFMIVYESSSTNGYVMKQADAISNYVEATIASDVIASKPNDAMSVIIEKFGTTDNYQIKVAGANPASYLKGASGNGLSFDASAQQTTISYDNTNGWLISNNSSWLRYNASSGQTRFRFYKSSSYANYGTVQFYKKTAGASSYSDYSLICSAKANAPEFNLTESTYTSAQTLTITAEQGASIYYTKDGSEPDNTKTLYTGAIQLDTYGEVTVKAIAYVAEKDPSDVVTKTYMMNLPFASLADLVTASEANKIPNNNATVTVTLSNIEIASFNGTKGVNLNVICEEKNVQIYNSTAFDTKWKVGGTLSHSSLTCTWSRYENKGTYQCWELTPADWDDFTYNDPVHMTSIAISGELTNKDYSDGQQPNPAGLVVTGTYSDSPEHTEVITEGLTWTLPTLEEGATTAQVSVKYTEPVLSNELTSDPYQVTINAVTPAKTLQSIYVAEDSEHKTEFFVGRPFSAEGLKVMAHYNMGDDQQIALANLTITNTTFSEAEAEHTINISYTENEVEKNTSYNVEVKYMNLSELVAEDVPTNTSVKVAFSDVEITGFYKNSSDKRAGVYVNVIGKNGSNIELYSGGTPSETLNGWQEGGKLASKGDYITGTWKYYDGGSVWEIDFGNAYAWSTNIEYTAPSIYPTAVALSETSATVKQSQFLNLEAIFTPVNATVLNNLEWSSDNTDVTVAPSQDKKSAIVTVAPDATVGTATITVKVDDEYGQTLSATCVITIEELPIWATTYTSNVTVGTDKVKLAEAYQPAGYPEDGYDAKKAGSGSSTGSTTITIPAGTYAIHFHAAGWNDEKVTLAVKKGETELGSFDLPKDAGMTGNSPFTLANDPATEEYFMVALSDITEETTITFVATSGKRFAIYGVNALAPAAITIDPTSKDFGKVKQGFDAEQVFTLAPNAFATGTITAEIEGDGFSASAVADNKVTVTFAPTEIKDYSATLIIKHDGTQMCTATLTGKGISATTPEIVVSDDEIDFGKVKQDASVAAQQVTVTLSYLETATASISEGAFTIDKTNLVIGDNTITISADASSMGKKNATITIEGEGVTSKTIAVTMDVISKYANEYTSNVEVGSDKVIIAKEEYEAIKTGSGSVQGSTTITVPEGAYALHFHAAGWNTEDVTLAVKNGDTELGSFSLYKDAGVKNNSPFTLEGENYDTDQYFYVEFDALEEETEFTFEATSGNRFVLYGVNQEGGLTKQLSAIEVSGTPNKLQYTEGNTFDPTGLTVMGTFKFGEVTLPDKEDVTDQVTEWVVDPVTLASTTTSVSVVAKVGEIASEAYIVENVRVLPENTDMINASTGTATTSTYKEFAATGLTNTQYAGKTALNDGNLTLSNAASHPGIVSTYTIGYIKSVKVTIADGNTHNLDVYGSHRAYQSAEDLYSLKNAIRGTKIGTLTASDVLDLSEAETKYEFIGIRSEEGSIQVPEIQITWTPVDFLRISVAENIEGGTIDIDRTVATAEEAGIVQVTIEPTPNEGLQFYKLVIYNESDEDVTASITIAESGLAFTMPDYNVKVGATFKSQPVTAISLDKSAITVDKNNTETLTASFLPQGAFTDVTWTSANEAIATVEDGVVTGKGQGTTTITASCNDGALTATCSVTVNAQPEYVLVTDAADLQDGDVIVLGSAAKSAANGGYISDKKYLDKVEATITDNVLTSNELMEITLYKTNDVWNLVTEDGPLGATAQGKLAFGSGTTTWSISIDANNAATIQNGTSDYGRFLYNVNNPRFTTYTSSTSVSMLLPEIYRLSNNTKKVVKLMDKNNVYAIYRVREGENVTLSVALPSGCTKGWIIDGKTYAKNATIENVTADMVLYAIQSQPKEIVGEDNEISPEDVNQGSTITIGNGTTETNVTISSETQEKAQAYQIVVKKNATVTISTPSDISNLEVEVGGKVTVETTKLTVNNFVIKSTMAGGESGQVLGVKATNFIITGSAYYDVVLGDNGNPDKWHAFAVPFNVDAINGIYDLDDNKLTNEVNYAIMDYHGDVRAQGQYGWKKFRGIMTPGVFYLMTVDGQRTTYRMKMNGGFHASSTTITVNEYASGTDTDAGWNGIANNQLGYSSVGVNVQVLNPTSYTYKTMTASEYNFTVGTPFFYQADATGTIDLTAPNASENYAPRRVGAAEAKNIAVTLGNDNYIDRLYISATDEATNEYQIGRDLVKMTMTNAPAVPQIFAEAYGTKLSMIDVPMMNDEAVYALNLYAPANGEYTMGAAQVEGYEVFLTQNGSVIWNLSMSEATIELTKGNNTEYGLILKATSGHAPTDINTINGQESVQKFLYNSNIYIIRENQKYNAQGIKIQ